MDDDETAAAYSQHGSSVVDDLAFLTNSYHATGGYSFPSSSSTSSSFLSAYFSYSPEISSTAAHVPMAPSLPAAASLVALAPGMVLLPYDDQYVANFHDTPAGGMSSTSACAFRPYQRHLVPQRRLTKPACGQRMFKTAMSVLANMHTSARYSHQQQQEQQQPPSGNQLQHLISERKRREKLNDSFRALKTVLPPASKKLGQESILITAREYVNSLKSKICELEEKNQALKSQLVRQASSQEEDEKVEINITRATAAADDHQAGEVCMVKIATLACGNTTDVVIRILQHLKYLMGEDVSLVSMGTGEDGDVASLTLHLKSTVGAKWEEEAVRKVVMKAMKQRASADLHGAD